MNYKIFFSPTGGTKKIADIASEAFGGEFKDIDISQKNFSPDSEIFTENDICIAAVPAFGGIMPNAAKERLENLKGNNAKVIIIVSFGNRDIDDTMDEAVFVLSNAGFRCIGGIAAVSQHSLMTQYGAGRPGAEDEKEIASFIDTIKNKGSELAVTKKEFKTFGGVPLHPKASSKCVKCGLCAKNCPVGAIDEANPAKTDTKKCITCMRCVKFCPAEARGLNKLMLSVAAKSMDKALRDKKENKLFI